MKNKKLSFSIVIILFWFSLYIYVPQLTNYAKELGASYKLIGLIGSAYGLSQTIFRIPLGILSDKLRRRKVFVLGGIVAAILSSGIIYFTPSPYSLLVARFIAGIASATWVNFTVLFISYFKPGESNKAVGIVNANSKLGQLIAMFLGGIIAARFGIGAIFLVSIVIATLSFIFGLTIYEKNIVVESGGDSSGILSVMKNKTILHISLLGAMVQLIAYSTNFAFTPIVASGLGASNLQLGYLSTIFNLPQVIFSVLAGTFIVNKIGEKKTLILGFALITFVCFMTPFAPHLNALYLLQIISGIGNAITFSLLMSMVIKGVEDELMTTTMGFYQAAYGVGMVIGPILLGVVGDTFGLTAGFITVGIVGILAMVSSFIIKDNNSQTTI